MSYTCGFNGHLFNPSPPSYTFTAADGVGTVISIYCTSSSPDIPPPTAGCRLIGGSADCGAYYTGNIGYTPPSVKISSGHYGYTSNTTLAYSPSVTYIYPSISSDEILTYNISNLYGAWVYTYNDGFYAQTVHAGTSGVSSTRVTFEPPPALNFFAMGM